MKTYLIIIDGLYFAGTDTESIGKAPAGAGWYDNGQSITKILLTPEGTKAKKIEGNINLKSFFNKIYDSVRYGNFEFEKLEIVCIRNKR